MKFKSENKKFEPKDRKQQRERETDLVSLVLGSDRVKERRGSPIEEKEANTNE